MVKNYLISAIRNFRRNSFFSTLNIIGLAVGIASALLILQYVQYEKSFDRFHSKAEDIYRIQYNNYQNGKLTFECAAAVPAVGPALKNNFPEILEFVRIMPANSVISYQDPVLGLRSFRENRIQIADESVFKIFDINLIKGDPSTCLDNQNKAVISEETAAKLFGDEDPIGKTISYSGEVDLSITGVFSDLPDNSHIKIDYIISNKILKNFWEDWEQSWGWYDHNTYVLVRPGTEIDVLQSKWDDYLAQNRGEDWDKSNSRQEFIFQPLTDIHLKSDLLQESVPQEQGDEASVHFLAIIAIFLLIIAWVNYINLSTAKSMERANEVGVRKVMGANRAQLRNQFLAESILLNLAATLLAVILVVLLWPFFVDLTGRNIPFNLLTQPAFWLIVGFLFLAGGLLTGFYPAIVLSSFRPVAVLKGKINTQTTGNVVRKGLVIFQFLASVVLITGSIIVFQQLHFMKNRDLGVDISETLVIEGPGIVDSLYDNTFSSFKNEIRKYAGIRSVSATTNVPGREIIWTNGIQRLSGGPENSLTTYIVGVDEDYFPSLKIPVIAGRNFSTEYPNDNERIIINQSLAEALEFDSPEEAIGAKVRHDGDTVEIAGVVADYHQMSLKTRPSPIVFRYFTPNSLYALKIETSDYQALLEKVEKSYSSFFPGNPFNYYFLDQFFNRQYDQDARFSRTFGLFTLLAIFIACLGLFGLASYMTTRRRKEIGIRKVLGSSKGEILSTLSSGFIKLVVIGTVLAWPVAWYVMDGWLSQFPYHIDINPLIFILSGFLVILVAIMSVSYQTLKTAGVNPAKTLRYE